MTTVAEAAFELESALKLVPDARVYRDQGANIEPRAIVIGPPVLAWESDGRRGPTSARFLVYAIVAADDRAAERLWEFVEVVADTIDMHTDAAVTQADPAVYVSGTSQLPCYEIQTEVPL